MNYRLSDLKSNPALAFPPEEWKSARPGERLVRLRQRLLDNERKVDLVRARLTTEIYRETGGAPAGAAGQDAAPLGAPHAHRHLSR